MGTYYNITSEKAQVKYILVLRYKELDLRYPQFEMPAGAKRSSHRLRKPDLR